MKKCKIAEIKDIYVINQVEFEGKSYIVAGSEKNDGILLYDCASKIVCRIADHPGGHMSLVALPTEYGVGLLAIGEFKPIFKSEKAGIYLYTPVSSLKEKWNCRKILDLPFVHRIEVVNSESGDWLIASTVCGGKAYTDDWSQAGAVYASTIPPTPLDPKAWDLQEILPGLHKNHGMYVSDLHTTGQAGVLVTAQEGVYYLTPPDKFGGSWKKEQLLKHEASDIVAYDLDNDGSKELVTIEPFHGDTCAMYKNIAGIWERHVINDNIAMGHALWAGKFNDANSIIIGWRKDKASLELINVNEKWPPSLKSQIIDRGEAPTQVTVFQKNGQGMIAIAANATSHLITYEVNNENN